MISIKEDTNLVNLRGELDNDLEFSHEIFGEKFYNTKIKINRLSESYDVLPITVSERLLQDIDFENNKFVIDWTKIDGIKQLKISTINNDRTKAIDMIAFKKINNIDTWYISLNDTKTKYAYDVIKEGENKGLLYLAKDISE